MSRVSRYGGGQLSQQDRYWRRRAKVYGNRWLPKAVVFWVGVLRDKNADPMVRMKAAENLADRFGLPRRRETEVDGVVGTEEMASAMRDLIEDAVRRILSDRGKYAVRAEDVPFEESNGNGNVSHG